MNQSEEYKQAKKICYDGKVNVLPVCSFCSQVPVQGIKGVIRVGKAWLCQTCETKITLLEVESSDYGVMIEKMKKVWR